MTRDLQGRFRPCQHVAGSFLNAAFLYVFKKIYADTNTLEANFDIDHVVSMRNHMVSMRIVQCAITRRHCFQKVACSSVHTDILSHRIQKPHFGSRF